MSVTYHSLRRTVRQPIEYYMRKGIDHNGPTTDTLYDRDI